MSRAGSLPGKQRQSPALPAPRQRVMSTMVCCLLLAFLTCLAPAVQGKYTQIGACGNHHYLTSLCPFSPAEQNGYVHINTMHNDGNLADDVNTFAFGCFSNGCALNVCSREFLKITSGPVNSVIMGWVYTGHAGRADGIRELYMNFRMAPEYGTPPALAPFQQAVGATGILTFTAIDVGTVDPTSTFTTEYDFGPTNIVTSDFTLTRTGCMDKDFKTVTAMPAPYAKTITVPYTVREAEIFWDDGFDTGYDEDLSDATGTACNAGSDCRVNLANLVEDFWYANPGDTRPIGFTITGPHGATIKRSIGNNYKVLNFQHSTWQPSWTALAVAQNWISAAGPLLLTIQGKSISMTRTADHAVSTPCAGCAVNVQLTHADFATINVPCSNPSNANLEGFLDEDSSCSMARVSVPARAAQAISVRIRNHCTSLGVCRYQSSSVETFDLEDRTKPTSSFSADPAFLTVYPLTGESWTKDLFMWVDISGTDNEIGIKDFQVYQIIGGSPTGDILALADFPATPFQATRSGKYQVFFTPQPDNTITLQLEVISHNWLAPYQDADPITISFKQADDPTTLVAPAYQVRQEYLGGGLEATPPHPIDGFIWSDSTNPEVVFTGKLSDPHMAISAVQYRINGGAWVNTALVLNQQPDYSIDFTLTTAGLDPTTNPLQAFIVDVMTTNAIGRITTHTLATVKWDPTPPTISSLTRDAAFDGTLASGEVTYVGVQDLQSSLETVDWRMLDTSPPGVAAALSLVSGGLIALDSQLTTAADDNVYTMQLQARNRANVYGRFDVLIPKDSRVPLATDIVANLPNDAIELAIIVDPSQDVAARLASLNVPLNTLDTTLSLDWTGALTAPVGNVLTVLGITAHLNGITEFEYWIGTTSGGAEIQGATSTGITPTAGPTISAPNLSPSLTIVYVTVRGYTYTRTFRDITRSIILDATVPVLSGPWIGQTLGVDDGLVSTSTIDFIWRASDADTDIFSATYCIGIEAGAALSGEPNQCNLVPMTVASGTIGLDDVAAYTITVADDTAQVFVNGATYYVTVLAYNNVGLQNVQSKAFVIDRTPLQPGVVLDGADPNADVDYSSDAIISATWKAFFDPDQAPVPGPITGFSVNVYCHTGDPSAMVLDGGPVALPSTATSTTYDTNAYSQACGQPTDGIVFVFEVTASATSGSAVRSSDGILVDLSDPVSTGATVELLSPAHAYRVTESSEHIAATGLVPNLDAIAVGWSGFFDEESGITSYNVRLGTPGGADDDITPGGKEVLGSPTTLQITPGSLVHGQSIRARVDARNAAGLEVSVYSQTVTVDQTAPVAPASAAVTATDDGNQPASITVAWPAFSEDVGAVTGYRVALLDGSGALLTHYESVDLAAATDGVGGYIFTISDVSLTDGATLLARVEAVNSAGLRSSVDSVGSVVDTSPPVAGVVSDGLIVGVDSSFQSSFVNILEATWTTFSDPQSSITQYEARGVHVSDNGTTTPLGAFQSVGVATTWTSGALTLSMDDRYAVEVRATNGAGLTTVARSNGVLVREELGTPSSNNVTVELAASPYHGAAAATYLLDASHASIEWTPFGSNVVAYEYCVSSNASSISGDLVPWTLTASGSSRSVSAPIQQTVADGSVAIAAVRAIGVGGTKTTAALSAAATFDLTAPSLVAPWVDAGPSPASLVPVNSGGHVLSSDVAALLSSVLFTDAHSGVTSSEIALGRTATGALIPVSQGPLAGTTWLPASALYDTTGSDSILQVDVSTLGPEAVFTDLAAPTFRYHLHVRAVDAAGLTSYASFPLSFVIDTSADVVVDSVSPLSLALGSLVALKDVELARGSRVVPFVAVPHDGQMQPVNDWSIVPVPDTYRAVLYLSAQQHPVVPVDWTPVAEMRISGAVATDATPLTGVFVDLGTLREGQWYRVGLQPCFVDPFAANASVPIDSDPFASLGRDECDAIPPANLNRLFDIQLHRRMGLNDVSYSPAALVTRARLPPVDVSEGHASRTDGDLDYSPSDSVVAAMWLPGANGAMDASPSLDHFNWGVGSAYGLFDIVARQNVRSSTTGLLASSSSLFAHGSTYFLSVEAVSLSGATAWASSDGFTVDTTAPEMPAQDDIQVLGAGAAAGFLISSGSVAVQWTAPVDPESGVVLVEWALATLGSNVPNVMYWQASTSSSGASASLTADHFVDGHSYVVFVRAVNRAGLHAFQQSHAFVAVTAAPQGSSSAAVNNVGVTGSPGSSVSTTDLNPDVVNAQVHYQTENDALACRWTPFHASSSIGIARYEWAVVAAPEERVLAHRANAASGSSLKAATTGEMVEDSVQSFEDLFDESTVSWRAYVEPFSNADTSYTVEVDSLHLDAIQLTEGHRYACVVRAVNTAGMTSAAVWSSGVVVDATGPRAGTVGDGNRFGIDASVQAHSTSVSAWWTGFFGGLAGIDHYEWAIGTSSGTADLMAFTAAGVADGGTSSDGVATAALTPNVASSVFVGVRSVTTHGLFAEAWSNGVVIDTSAPSSGSAALTPRSAPVAFVTPAAGAMTYQVFTSLINLQWSGFGGGSSPQDHLEYFVDVYSNDDAASGERALRHVGVGTATSMLRTLCDPETKDALLEQLLLDNAPNLDFGRLENNPFLRSFHSHCVEKGSSPKWFGLRFFEGEVLKAHVTAVDDTGLSSPPITSNAVLVDPSPPLAGGRVYDGATPLVDGDANTNTATTISASWHDFVDPQSGIASYSVAVGYTVGGQQHLAFTTVGTATSMTNQAPTVNLVAGVRYFVTVRAYNAAGLHAQISSDGFWIGVSYDPTNAPVAAAAPVAGIVRDGFQSGQDIEVQAYDCTLSATWDAFAAGGDVHHYEVGYDQAAASVPSSGWLSVGLDTSVVFAGLDLDQGVEYKVFVRAMNNHAGGSGATAESDGVVVDILPPNHPPDNDKLVVVEHASSGAGSASDGLDIDFASLGGSDVIRWDGLFTAGVASSIVKYELAIGTTPGGTQVQAFQDQALSTSGTPLVPISQPGNYYASVRATNDAGLSAVAFSDGIIYDSSAPLIGVVHLGRFPSEADPKYESTSATELSAYWHGFTDFESGILSYKATLLADNGSGWTPVAGPTDVGLHTSTTFSSLTPVHLTKYRISVDPVNGAGLVSTAASSATIAINDPSSSIVSAQVNDGPGPTDTAFQTDPTSISASWSLGRVTPGGQEDVSRTYQWAVGTTAGGVQVHDFQTVVDRNIGDGASVDVDLSGLSLLSGTSYYVSVLEIFHVDGLPTSSVSVLTTSDGVMLDTTPPHIKSLELIGDDSLPGDHSSEYAVHDSIVVQWVATDAESGIADFEVVAFDVTTGTALPGVTLPSSTLSLDVSASMNLVHGHSYSIRLTARSNAGLLSDVVETAEPVLYSDILVVGAVATVGNSVGDGALYDADLVYQVEDDRLVASWEEFDVGQQGHFVISYEIAFEEQGGAMLSPFYFPIENGKFVFELAGLALGLDKTYVARLRGLTNVGDYIEVLSDGVTVISKDGPSVGTSLCELQAPVLQADGISYRFCIRWNAFVSSVPIGYKVQIGLSDGAAQLTNGVLSFDSDSLPPAGAAGFDYSHCLQVDHDSLSTFIPTAFSGDGVGALYEGVVDEVVMVDHPYFARVIANDEVVESAASPFVSCAVGTA